MPGASRVGFVQSDGGPDDEAAGEASPPMPEDTSQKKPPLAVRGPVIG